MAAFRDECSAPNSLVAGRNRDLCYSIYQAVGYLPRTGFGLKALVS
ncbi:hypothetical protein [Nitrobacter hamburgensis]|jgi:hypothetical protein|nr:hypothetical protein [Nitrobacter hamburgensis]